MAKRSRKLEETLLRHSLQLLTTRRFDLYSSLAPLFADLEEAVDERNVRGIIEKSATVHRRMRESLAYLNRAIWSAMSRVEEAIEGGDDVSGGLDLEGLRIALLRLHVEMARSLRDPSFEPIEDILGVDAGLRVLLHKGGEKGRRTDRDRRMEEALEFSRRGWKLLSEGKHGGAAKQFRKALDLLPGDPKFRADLGQALVLSGDATGAVAELTLAVGRYEESPGEAGDQRRAIRALGRARRTLSEEKFQRRQIEEAIEALKSAVGELEGSLKGEPDLAEKETTRSEIEAARLRLRQLEEIWAKVSGLPGK